MKKVITLCKNGEWKSKNMTPAEVNEAIKIYKKSKGSVIIAPWIYVIQKPSIEAVLEALEKAIGVTQHSAEELARDDKVFEAFIKVGEAVGIAFAVWHLRNWQSKNPPNNQNQADASS